MQITVRYYGIIGDLAGRAEQRVELPDDATLADLLARLTAENPAFVPTAKQVRAVANGQALRRDDPLGEATEIVLMRAIGGGGAGSGRRIVHADLPIVPSPSGLPTQHVVHRETGATSLFVGQQWLRPGDRVLLHTHPVEEAVMFLSGSGEATLGDEIVAIGAGTSLFFPPGLVHGFRNTGDGILHVIVVFPVPEFAETTIVEAR